MYSLSVFSTCTLQVNMVLARLKQNVCITLQKCKGHFHVAIYMVISVASVQMFPMVAVLLQSLTTNSWKQIVVIRISM